MPVETEKYLIAASNILFGVTNFILLPLPKPWRLGRGISPPEVNSTTRGDSLWVTSGRVSHIVFDSDRRIGLELTINISRGERGILKPRISEVTDQGSALVGGHKATYALGKVKRGLFGKKVVGALQLSFYCDKTRRTIDLNFTGDCAEEDLRQILEALPQLECH